MSSLNYLNLICISIIFFSHVVSSFDYGAALTKSLLYYEAQRSGKLPPNQRVTWRGDSAQNDGKDAGVYLAGGYYDSGDNVKFGFPMAFTITMLAWSTLESYNVLSAKNELEHAKEAIKWGTDYLLRAHPTPNVLYGQVGEGQADHNCWQRPEDMTTPRTTYRIDEQHPGADLAAETAAALAAASIVFYMTDHLYGNLLKNHAKQLFDFARKYPGLYSNSIPASPFYSSSGYEDELLWAAAWIYKASGEQIYLNYLASSNNTGGTRTEFSWDDKFVGTQTLIAKLVLEGKLPGSGIWPQYKSNGEGFICNVIQKGYSNIQMTPGGVLWTQPWNNLQYVASASLVVTTYAKSLSIVKASLSCPRGTASSNDLTNFAKSQVDYILGNNPKKTSYMVGYGEKYPTQTHHRASSIISYKVDPKPVTCGGGYADWYNRNAPNPNILHGAIVGGPDQNDAYNDTRYNYMSNEPSTTTVAPMVGLLAMLS